MEPDTTSDVVYPPEIEELIRILQMLLDRKIVDVPPELRKQWPSVKYVLGRDVDENFPFDSTAKVFHAATFAGVLEFRGEAIENLQNQLPKEYWSHNCLRAYFVSNCDAQYCFSAHYRHTRVRLQRAVKAIVAGKATKTQKNYVRACAEADAGSKHNEPIRRPTTHRDRFVREFRTAHRDYELYVWTRSSEMDDKIRAETAAIQDKIEVFDTWKEDDYKPRSETEELLVCYARILDRPVPNSTSPEDDGSKEPSSGLDSEDIGRSVAKKKKRGKRGGKGKNKGYKPIEEPLAQLKPDTRGYKVEKSAASQAPRYKPKEDEDQAEKEVLHIDLTPFEGRLKHSRILQALLTPMLGSRHTEGHLWELEFKEHDLIDFRKLSLQVPGLEIAQLDDNGFKDFEKRLKALDLNRGRYQEDGCDVDTS